jgi:hypothetical protein
MKTNLIKSFMKAGIFPLNPNSIDRSRILNNYMPIVISSSSLSIDMTINSQIEPIRTEITTPISMIDDPIVFPHQPMVDDTSITEPIVTGFVSTSEAVLALNKIIQKTSLDEDDGNDGDDNNDNDDDEYIPTVNISSSNLHSTLNANDKRKKRFRKIIHFDTSDEEGKTQIFTMNCSKQSIFF